MQVLPCKKWRNKIVKTQIYPFVPKLRVFVLTQIFHKPNVNLFLKTKEIMSILSGLLSCQPVLENLDHINQQNVILNKQKKAWLQ